MGGKLASCLVLEKNIRLNWKWGWLQCKKILVKWCFDLEISDEESKLGWVYIHKTRHMSLGSVRREAYFSERISDFFSEKRDCFVVARARVELNLLIPLLTWSCGFSGKTIFRNEKGFNITCMRYVIWHMMLCVVIPSPWWLLLVWLAILFYFYLCKKISFVFQVQTEHWKKSVHCSIRATFSG